MAVESAGAQLLILHLVEPVGTHVEPVALGLQIVHQLTSTLHQARLRGAEVEKQITGVQTVLLGRLQSVAITQRTTETLDNQVVASNLTTRIAGPQVDVRLPIAVVEHLWIGKPSFQMQRIKEFAKGNDRIAMRIIKGIIEIDEEVGILFHLLRL